MFTGLVEASVPVLAVRQRGTGCELWVARPGSVARSQGPREAAQVGAGHPSLGDFAARVGDSVSVSGCCLTVVAPPEEAPPGAAEHPAPLVFDLSAETLDRTWFKALAPGSMVNLERALCVGDRLDGHMVSGHVDAVGRLVGLADSGDGGWRLTIAVPAGFERWLVDKGSVTIDGISLTVVAPKGDRFDVAVIPHTFRVTSFAEAQVGQPVNLEADLVGKWIERLVAGR